MKIKLILLCVALEMQKDIHSQHMPRVFPQGGVGISSSGETFDNGVNHEAWIFLKHFQKKIMKVVVIKEGVAQ